jgi:hypothetical protein
MFSLYEVFVDGHSMFVWVIVSWLEELEFVFSCFACNNEKKFPSLSVFCVFLPSRPVLPRLNFLVQYGVKVDKWVTKCSLSVKSAL